MPSDYSPGRMSPERRARLEQIELEYVTGTVGPDGKRTFLSYRQLAEKYDERLRTIELAGQSGRWTARREHQQHREFLAQQRRDLAELAELRSKAAKIVSGMSMKQLATLSMVTDRFHIEESAAKTEWELARQMDPTARVKSKLNPTAMESLARATARVGETLLGTLDAEASIRSSVVIEREAPEVEEEFDEGSVPQATLEEICVQMAQIEAEASRRNAAAPAGAGTRLPEREDAGADDRAAAAG